MIKFRRWGMVSQMEDLLSSILDVKEELEKVSHTFTKYKATLTPLLCIISKSANIPKGYEFIDSSDLDSYPFSSGHRRIVNNYLSYNSCI